MCIYIYIKLYDLNPPFLDLSYHISSSTQFSTHRDQHQRPAAVRGPRRLRAGCQFQQQRGEALLVDD